MTLFITIVEIIYLYYMFQIFRTKYTFHHPFENIVNNNLDNYFNHPIGIENTNQSKICKFGRDGSLILIWYLILRFLLIYFKLIPKKILIKINNFILFFIFIISWMNLNAVIYFLPFIIFDFNYFY